MPFPPEVEAARSWVFELYGRTILRFQGLEQVIKHLVRSSDVRLEDQEAQFPNELNPKATLGLNTEALFSKVLLSSEHDANEPPADVENAAPPDKVSITLSFKMPLGPECHAAWAARLRDLIDRRNELVHHALERFKLDSVAGCEAVVSELENLLERLQQELTALTQLGQQQQAFAQEALAIVLRDFMGISEPPSVDDPSPDSN